MPPTVMSPTVIPPTLSLDAYYWQSQGLQIGLRIIQINNTSLLDYHHDNGEDPIDEDINPDLVLTKEEIDTIIAEADTQETFMIKFREEVNPEDQSIPLGLQYSTQDILEEEVDGKEDASEGVKGANVNLEPRKSNKSGVLPLEQRMSNGAVGGTQRASKPLRIEHSQIGASSFEKGFEPRYCRLNHPQRYWSPSDDDQTTLDTWLRIDLGMRRMVTKLHLQGMCLQEDTTAIYK